MLAQATGGDVVVIINGSELNQCWSIDHNYQR
jgi:hypothetical protein